MSAAKKKNLQALPPIFQTDDPVQLLELFRVVWLRGRYGGGKTSLGIWLTYQLLTQRKARYVVSNLKLTMPHLEHVRTLSEKQLIRDLLAYYEIAAEAEDVRTLDAEFSDCIFLIDEAWGIFSPESPQQLRNSFLAYPRKLNQYLILPSFRLLHRSVWAYTIARAVNFRAALGIPCWWYALETRDGEETVKASYSWWFPERVFKLYDTRAVVKDMYHVYKYNPPHSERVTIKKERDKLNLAAFVPNFLLLLVGVWVLWIAWQVLNPPPPVDALPTSIDIYLPLVLNN